MERVRTEPSGAERQGGGAGAAIAARMDAWTSLARARSRPAAEGALSALSRCRIAQYHIYYAIV